MTFYEYLERSMKESETIDFSLRVTQTEGNISFYVHPSGVNGLTRDFVLTPDGIVSPDPKVTYEGEM